MPPCTNSVTAATGRSILEAIYVFRTSLARAGALRTSSRSLARRAWQRVGAVVVLAAHAEVQRCARGVRCAACCRAACDHRDDRAHFTTACACSTPGARRPPVGTKYIRAALDLLKSHNPNQRPASKDSPAQISSDRHCQCHGAHLHSSPGRTNSELHLRQYTLWLKLRSPGVKRLHCTPKVVLAV